MNAIPKVRQISVIPLTFVIAIVLSFTVLGFWQLGKFYDKQWLVNKTQDQVSKKPIKNITNFDNTILYSKVRLKGSFIPKKDVHLYAQASGRATDNNNLGYYLLSPFRTTDGKIIMVMRGGFRAMHKRVLYYIKNKDYEKLTGILLPNEKTGMLTPGNDIKNNLWFNVDLGTMSKALGLPLENVYLLQVDANNLPDIVSPISMQNHVNVDNNHFVYAMTWFVLGIVVIIMFGAYLFQGNKTPQNFMH